MKKCSPANAAEKLSDRAIIRAVTIYWGAVIGFFMGFGFGVGCALAVMYSIYLGGYRAALRDLDLPEPPERLLRARARVAAENRAQGSGSGAQGSP